MNNKYGATEKYRSLITSLKIMHIRADYTVDAINAERYKKAYNILEDIQEKRHLTLIGQKGGYREIYNKILEIIEEKNINTESQTIELIIDEINGIYKKYQLKINEEKVKENSKEGEER